VQDYSRYIKLLTKPGEDATEEEIAALAVSPDETAQAVAATPADAAVRATHALALLRAGRPEEALGVFDDLTVFYGRVPPALQAVICRVLADGGRGEFAMRASQDIDKKKLTQNEMSLLQGIQ
jgi:hypothetical protein